MVTSSPPAILLSPPLPSPPPCTCPMVLNSSSSYLISQSILMTKECVPELAGLHWMIRCWEEKKPSRTIRLLGPWDLFYLGISSFSDGQLALTHLSSSSRWISKPAALLHFNIILLLLLIFYSSLSKRTKLNTWVMLSMSTMEEQMCFSCTGITQSGFSDYLTLVCQLSCLCSFRPYFVQKVGFDRHLWVRVFDVMALWKEGFKGLKGFFFAAGIDSLTHAPSTKQQH